MSVRLSVNLNAIAFLRNRRDLPWPCLTSLARIALYSGAHGLTVHPRPDQRHIRESDILRISDLIKTEFPLCSLNIEGFPSEEFLALVERNQPDQVTLVPDSPEQSTSDHGWDFVFWEGKLSPVIKRLKGLGSRVSLFANPVSEGLQIASDLGADSIEIYTGLYGSCQIDPLSADKYLEPLYTTACAARNLGLRVHAGHDLTIKNLAPLIDMIPFLHEVSIGHALIAEALEHGMAGATERFLEICR